MKRTLKSLWAGSFYHTGALSFYLWSRRHLLHSQEAVILTYHRVIPQNMEDAISSLAGIVVSEDTFEKQIRFLTQHYHPLSFGELIEASEAHRTLPPGALIITFDDGWEDNYLSALPILKKYGCPATVFLTTDYIGAHKTFWQEHLLSLMSTLMRTGRVDAYIQTQCPDMFRDSLKALKTSGFDGRAKNGFIEKLKYVQEKNRNLLLAGLEAFTGKHNDGTGHDTFLSWEQAKEMSQHRITFGSHGVSHRILTLLEKEELMKELTDSKARIKHALGVPVDVFAYPNGDYNDMVRQCLRESGYKASVTTIKGINRIGKDLFLLKRINIHEGSSSPKKRPGAGLPYCGFSESLFAARLALLL